jgi:acetyl esterase/lipase
MNGYRPNSTPSLRARLLGPLSQQLLAPAVRLPVAARRRRIELLGRLLLLSARDVGIEPVTLGGIPAERIVSNGENAPRYVLYLHGGAYVFGSPFTHRALTTRLALAASAVVLAVDYRLAPEHPHPAALEDAMTAYRALLAQQVPASRIVISGDSAGGGLSLALALAIRDAQLPLPAALALLSPWTDLSLSGASHQACASRERLLSTTGLSADAQAYAGASDLRSPPLSPLFADLRGLPPMLVQVGSDEILLDDSRRLATAASAAGVPITLQVWPGLWHVWQLFGGWLPEADRAISELGRYIRQTTESLPTSG